MVRVFFILILFYSNIIILYSQKIKPAFKNIVNLNEIYYYPEPIVVINCKDVKNTYGIDLFGSAEASNRICDRLYEIGKRDSLKRKIDTSTINQNLYNYSIIINTLKKYARKDSAIKSQLIVSMIDTFSTNYICIIVQEAFYKHSKKIAPEEYGSILAGSMIANAVIVLAGGGFFIVPVPNNSRNALSRMYFYLIEKSSMKVIYTISDVQQRGFDDVSLPFTQANTELQINNLIYTLQDAIDMNIRRYKRNLKRNKE